MKNIGFAGLSGLLFGIGLTISTMVDPQRVLGFLDLFGQWDPTLIFVMGGGLSVYLPFYHLVIKTNQRTLFNQACDLPAQSNIDKKLIVGAILFGLGWGLSGICPGPALANISSGSSGIIWFVGAMLVGMMIASKVERNVHQ